MKLPWKKEVLIMKKFIRNLILLGSGIEYTRTVYTLEHCNPFFIAPYCSLCRIHPIPTIFK